MKDQRSQKQVQSTQNQEQETANTSRNDFKGLSSDLYPGVLYDPHSGILWRLNTDLGRSRVIHVDYDGYCCYTCPATDRKIKKKAQILAWEIMHGSVPENFCLYSKDWTVTNIKAWCLGLIPKNDYVKLKEALWNLMNVKIVPHKNDAYVYFVHYKLNSVQKKVKCHDIVYALRLKSLILKKSTRLAGKYLISS